MTLEDDAPREERFEKKLIGNRYMFNASPLAPVVAVAVAGGANDWACYIAGLTIYSEPLPGFLERVFREGYKLTEAQARAFFPGEEREYRE